MNTTPKRADVGVYDGHEYGAEGLTKFRVIERFGNIYEGTVFSGELIHVFDGDKDLGTNCAGYVTSGPGTFWTEIPAEFCEEFQEDDVDPIEQHFENLYAAEFAKDKPGALPFQFLVFAIRDLEKEADRKKFSFTNKGAEERNSRWLKALKEYKRNHYGNLE